MIRIIREHYLTILILTVALIAGSCFPSGGGREGRQGSDSKGSEYYLVIRVTDGDTFVVDDGSAKGARVRLIGVDAPESRRSGRKEIGYYGLEAKEFMTTLILNKRVRLEYDVNKYDQYMRILAYVYLEDGTFVNAHLVESGYAMVMTVPPNVKHAETFLKLQQKARVKNRGLWGREVENRVEF
ncbi:MAG: thermonuclease family protein [Bacteroidales bacterium]|nr:thermonuclease family protein [Bacteroidales bacterium]